MRGDLKQITNYIFNEKIGNDTVTLSGKWTTKNVVSYNRSGNLLSVISYNAGYAPIDSVIFIYNPEKGERTGKGYSAGLITKTYKREWQGKYNYTGLIYDAENKLIAKTITSPDSGYRIFRQNTDYCDPNQKLSDREMTSIKFDGKNNSDLMITRDIVNNYEIYRVNNRDYAFDSFGNATKSVKETRNLNRLTARLILREYLYYQVGE